MSCNGCRVLRKGCSENCVLRPCLEWIESPEAQGHATLFVSKFFGRSDLINFISAVPSHKRTALFQSLLFEAVGRTVNPVNGAIGLLSTGNWHLCQAAVKTVLAGGRPTVLPNRIQIPETDERSEVSQASGAWPTVMIRNQMTSGNCSNANAPPRMNLRIASAADERSYSRLPASNISEASMSSQCINDGEPKLLNFFV